MKYRTFARLAWIGGISLTALLGWGAVRAMSGRPASPSPAQAIAPPPPAPIDVPPPAPVAPPAAAPPTTGELRAKLEDWLTAHGDRRGQTRWNDIFPAEPCRIDVLRFKDPDAAKFSNDPSQWSQFRLDLDRDGVVDEKWLLKNGHTYKREVLDRDGRTTQTQYFNK